jgi:hypothetical protein
MNVNLNFSSHLTNAGRRRKEARVVRVCAAVDALQRLQAVARYGALEDFAPVLLIDSIRVWSGSQRRPSHRRQMHQAVAAVGAARRSHRRIAAQQLHRKFNITRVFLRVNDFDIKKYLCKNQFFADASEIAVQQPVEKWIPKAIAQSRPRDYEVHERRHLENLNKNCECKKNWMANEVAGPVAQVIKAVFRYECIWENLPCFLCRQQPLPELTMVSPWQ